MDYRSRFMQRLGLGPLVKTDLLIHSVSMGETIAAIPLIRQIMVNQPQLSITVTTTSPTGSAEVIKAFGEQVQHCYLPLDFSVCVAYFLGKVNPRTCIIMETELWPNLIYHLQRKRIPTMLANARLSAKSAANYAKYPKLTQPMLQSLSVIAVQTEVERQRFITLGVDEMRIETCGSLKFDLHIAAHVRDHASESRQAWQRQSSPVWVAGSIHPGEFDVILEAHQQLVQRWPQALLIMVPRHPEQFDNAARQIEQHGFSYVRRSQGTVVTASTQVLLGDTMGELLGLYAVADQAFVGGSLISNGAHNPLEPAALGVPVLMGPHYWNFAEISELLNEAGAMTIVNNSEQLCAALMDKFENEHAQITAGEAGLAIVAANAGATQKQWSLLLRLLA